MVDRFVRQARIDAAWLSGAVLIAEWRGGRSGLIGFTRVRPKRSDPFQPLRHEEITPQQLDRLIRAVKRWKLDIVSLDEACRRLADGDASRFVSLGFDGRYRDVLDHAHPVLTAHGVPYTVYVPSAFPDGIAEPWWLALEAVIARRERISLMIDRTERHFVASTAEEKQQLFEYLSAWMRTLGRDERRAALRDLCTRYDVDVAALTKDSALTWPQIVALAADPNVTIASATVSYEPLSAMSPNAASREIAMGQSVLSAALQRPIRHFAYPVGNANSFEPRHAAMVRDAGFVTAVTAKEGTLDARQRVDLHALPRLMWHGEHSTIRGLRAMLSGAVQV